MVLETDDELRAVLDYETIAVVGCSTSPGKAAHDVPRYLLDSGYEIVPVNPFADEIFGRHAYDSLADVEEDVDVVDVFRPSEEVPGIVAEAVARDDVDVVWLQLGITHDEAAADAERAGLDVVQDRCLKVEHHRLA